MVIMRSYIFCCCSCEREMMSSMMTLILKHQGYFTLMTFADFLLHLKIANDGVHCKKIAHDEHR